MNSVPMPIGRRTRRQLAIKDNELRDEVKRRWFAARSNWRNRQRGGVKLKVFDDDNDENASHVYYRLAENVPKDDGRNDECSDDSLEIIGERWNPDDGYESRSSATTSDSDSEQVAAVGSLGNDGKEVSEKDGDHSGGFDDANVANDCRPKSEEENCGKKRVRASNAAVFRRFEGLVLAKEVENNAPVNSFVSGRTRSHLRSILHRRKRRNGTFSSPVVIDDGSSSSSVGDEDDRCETQNNRRVPDDPDAARSRGIGSVRKRRRPHRSTYVEKKSEPTETGFKLENDAGGEDSHEIRNNRMLEDTKSCEIAAIRKRGRPCKMTYVETLSEPKNDCDPQPEPVTCTKLENKQGNGCETQNNQKSEKTKFVENASIGKRDEPKNDLDTERETCTKLENNHMPKDTKFCEIANIRTSGRLHRNVYVENSSNLETCTMLENNKGGENPGILAMRKRGRPLKNRNAEEDSTAKRMRRTLNSNELEIVMLSTFLENKSAELETLEEYLRLKFSFRIQNLLPEMSAEKEEIEELFSTLEFALQVCHVGCSTSFSDVDEDNDEVPSYESVVVQTQLCRPGKHYLILDDEIGIRCQFCSFMKLAIRDVTPNFDDNRVGESGNKNNNHCIAYNKYSTGGEHVHSDGFRGTVWDLILGKKKKLYPHQREASEFIWENFGGSIKFDKIVKHACFRSGGCIVCHTPGTGPTCFGSLGIRTISGHVDDDRRNVELRKLMNPFVHGLLRSDLFLNPSHLPKMCSQQLSCTKYMMEVNHLVSVTCVHPSVLAVCNHVPEIINEILMKTHTDNLEVGLKIKFLLKLIRLAVGEKILVLNQYMPLLNFTSNLLRSLYSWSDVKEFLYMKGPQDAKLRRSFIKMFNDPSSVRLSSHYFGDTRGREVSSDGEEGPVKRLSELVFSSEGESEQKKRMLSIVFSEDRIPEEMIRDEKTNRMVSKIVCESKADELIKSVTLVNG